tara:strand:- start:11502 stop:12224 length:723 start_codon:yes stop_codon:yes gene_type:complete
MTIIIIPCFNEEKRILKTLQSIKNGQIENISFLFVDDGSVDRTASIISSFLSDKISLLRLKKNLGKGFAIKRGFEYLKTKGCSESYASFGYMDADLPITLSELNLMISKVASSSRDMVYACRREGKLRVKRRFGRGSISLFFGFAVKKLFSLNVSDTQCGVKVFNRTVMEILRGRKFLSDWLFDLELFLYISNQALLFEGHFVSEWQETRDGKFKPLVSFHSLFFQFIKIYYGYKNNQYN